MNVFFLFLSLVFQSECKSNKLIFIIQINLDVFYKFIIFPLFVEIKNPCLEIGKDFKRKAATYSPTVMQYHLR